MKMKKIMLNVVLVAIAIPIAYGGKHIAHVKCVESALEMHCKKSYQGFQKVEAVEVPWWNPFNDDGYACSAKVVLGEKVADVAFTAKRATLSDFAKEDWEVDLGFWGWIGDDYRIINVKAK